MKKFGTAILAVCLIMSCLTLTAFAAEGSLQFTDPETQQGKTVELEGVVRGGEASLGTIGITMNYDTNALQFISGDNVTGGDGMLNYAVNGDGSQTEIRFKMRFNVLTVGETVVQATEATATLNSGEELNLELGGATVKAAEGDGTTAYEIPASNVENTKAELHSEAEAIKVTANGQSYTFTDTFPAEKIPEGFKETMLTYENEDHKFLVNSQSGVTLGYLIDEGGEGAFFLFQTDENGEQSLYQSTDTIESQQKSRHPETEDVEEVSRTGVLGEIQDFINNHLVLFLCMVMFLVIILLILTVFFMVKAIKRGQKETEFNHYEEIETEVSEVDDEYSEDEYEYNEYDDELDTFFANEHLDDFETIEPVEETKAEDEEDYSINFLDL